MKDMAVCPECSYMFAVFRYGRRVPCPDCKTELDIQPNDPPPTGWATTEDWKRALAGEISYLTDVVEELSLNGCKKRGRAMRQIRAQIKRLQEHLKREETLEP